MQTPSAVGAIPQTGDKGAKTGSNLRKRAFAAVLNRELAAWSLPLRRAGREYRRACKRLFSRKDLRIASEIVTRFRAELHRTNLENGGDAAKARATKAKLRRKLERELSQALPAYREWRRLSRAHHRQQRQLLAVAMNSSHVSDVHVNLVDVLPPTTDATQEFLAPYSISYLYQKADPSIAQERSVAVPSIGHIVNNVEFRHEDDGPLVGELFGLNDVEWLYNLAACGVDFTMPKAGRLRIGAALRNFYNRITYSARDRFGLSESNLVIGVRLIVVVVHQLEAEIRYLTIFADGLTSFGTDMSFQSPGFDTASLHLIETTTHASYPANASVEIYAGGEVVIGSEIDDMRTYANTLLWWKLEKLTVDVV